MIEALLVILGVGLLSALGLLAPLLPSEWLIRAGWLCAVSGLLIGIPTGFWYHVRLRASLLRSGRLSQRWWLRPSSLHDRLDPGDRTAVLLWFTLGGVGFLVTLLGCLLVGAGVVLEGMRAGVF